MSEPPAGCVRKPWSRTMRAMSGMVNNNQR